MAILRSSHRRGFIKKSGGREASNFIKKRLQHRCSPLNIRTFLRALILTNICKRLLLNFLLLFPVFSSTYSWGTSVGKPAFWYTNLKLSGDHLYVIRNTFRPDDQKIDPRKSAYLINYSLKLLNSLSREPFVL